MITANINKQEDVDERCKACFIKTYQRLFDKFNIGIDQRQNFITLYWEILNKNKHLSSPEIQRELSIAFCNITNIVDPFEKDKYNSNAIALELYLKWKPKVLSSLNSFDLALRLAIAGNIMDYGANNSFDINDTINTVLKASFAINHSILLNNKIKEVQKILYLGDNAGEIVFDKLFIETIMHSNVTYAVKNAPILNDVTLKDAFDVEIDLVADVISNGYDAPSTILSKSSHEFLNVFNSADLIISKGQGNFEGLLNLKDPRIFFLLMVKCDFIAEILKVEKGSFVVVNMGNPNS